MATVGRKDVTVQGWGFVCVRVGAGLGTDAVVLVDPREAPGTVGEVDHLKETGG